ncbi:MAG TPA: polymer-forming cytoskeletal protein, partial [Longimicrobiales bacterium]|nr:polymer-forming cytoskeletal protein [Longimicrobiales bacterium]
MRRMTGWLAVLLAVAPLTAQERGVSELDLPRGVANEVIAFFNDPTTIRFQGRAQVPTESVILGNVAVLGGPLQVAGEITGDVVVVNGDLLLEETGRITGDVTVIGGSVVGPVEGVLGQLTVFSEPLAYRRQGERIAYDERPWSQWAERRRFGSSYFSLRAE